MEILNTVNDILWTYILIAVLLAAAVWFTIRTRGVQFRMFMEMLRLLCSSGKRENADGADRRHSVSSFQAFAVSIASRVGTGNLAGVATAIAVGGPGAVFWMWVIALLGASSAFVESTLAQLFKTKASDSFRGGPAYYIQKGMGKRWFAIVFAILISLTFGLAFNSVQANTITAALDKSFGLPVYPVGVVLAVMTAVVIWGGIHRISRFSEIAVPVMAGLYILLAIVILVMSAGKIPYVLQAIVTDAFSGDSVVGGGLGMTIMMGVKRGLFSNEAGEGSAPNVAATAAVSHPVKQGLIQTFAVFTDTLLICTCTAIIILCSGVYTSGESGIRLTQLSLESEIGATGSAFVSVAVFFFAFTSIVSNYYYGETNLRFIKDSDTAVNVYKFAVSAMVFTGAVTSLDLAWGLADIFMGLMTLVNLTALAFLWKYAVILLKDYEQQKRLGRNPVYRRSTIPKIASETECWPD